MSTWPNGVISCRMGWDILVIETLVESILDVLEGSAKGLVSYPSSTPCHLPPWSEIPHIFAPKFHPSLHIHSTKQHFIISFFCCRYSIATTRFLVDTWFALYIMDAGGTLFPICAHCNLDAIRIMKLSGNEDTCLCFGWCARPSSNSSVVLVVVPLESINGVIPGVLFWRWVLTNCFSGRWWGMSQLVLYHPTKRYAAMSCQLMRAFIANLSHCSHAIESFAKNPKHRSQIFLLGIADLGWNYRNAVN